MDKTTLGDRMKNNYENISRYYLTRRMPVIIRIDGKAFHTFTRGFKKPFDDILVKTMQETMKYLCENIQGCVLGYTQSDEISLVLVDYAELTTDAWFGNNLQKMCSVSASMTTLAFNKAFTRNISKQSKRLYTEHIEEKDASYIESLEIAMNKGAMFDSRVFTIPKEEVCKILTSSGTSSQVKSKIFLDKVNLLNQTKTLNHIIASFLGSSRLPMVIFDTSMIRKDRTMFSARGGGVIGFSLFGRKPIYALDENMELDIEALETFFKEHQDERVLFFGYTFMIWQYIVKVLEEKNIKFNFKNAVLFHTGGWKKLQSEAVEPKAFIERVKNVLGNVEVYNQYGMAEQLGSVYIECECGHMHPSNFSDVIIRRSKDFSVANVGEKGLMQLVSVIQTSYPGHSILTEDQGVILGVDNCPCGRKGKFFKILGRIKNAELRGCSDTFSK